MRPSDAAFLAALLLAGCSLPRDQHGTLQRVRDDTLHAGITEAPPFIVRRGEEQSPGGVEATLIQEFAEALGSEVAWHWGETGDHMEALARRELDLVAGELTSATAWKRHVGLTRPYYGGHTDIGAPPGIPAPEAWDGIAVAVREGSALAAQVEAVGAEPIRVASPERYPGFVAAPEWQLLAWGREPAHRLQSVRHVLAVPPGENAFIVALERFLAGREESIARALVEEASP